ncbi:MAG TPA: S41 family peptidase [Ktedonobacteraceae bacterium]|nr:S41 family peptidase [Ktedonobacteraceae bacterium]
MSRYDDPRWYEEQDANPSPLRQPPFNDFSQYPYPSIPPAENDVSQRQQRAPQQLSSNPGRRFQLALGQLLSLVALVVVAFLGGWFSHQFFGDSFQQSSQSQTYSHLFQQAWNAVDQNYVDRKAVNYKQMSYAAIQAMVDSLKDKGHTRFLTPEQVQAENQQLSGTFTGIGIYLRQDPTTKQLIITSPIPGSPAEKSGLKHGDVIIAVNGVSTAGKDVAGVSTLIQGNEGTSVAITVQRPGTPQPLTFHVTRAKIQVPNVLMHYMPQSHIAHIQIVQFADGISSQLRDAVNQAKSLGATKIILDLRDNPGGYLNEAVNTASLFVKSGNVLLEQDSTGQRQPVPVNGNAIDTNITIVVLVNENSASAAEIVTGALQDNKRAIIIGQTTFGTGTVLQQYPLDDGSAILLGTQEWLTPNGHFIRDQGITPDITVKLAPNAAMLTPNDENTGNMTEQQIIDSGDAQLVAAIKYLKEH